MMTPEVERPALGRAELLRYSRHLLIPEVGVAGQERLKRASVLCIGAGGLGSPVLSYLAAAGVGRLGIIDDDVVDVSNLQRQILYTSDDVGRAKASVAAQRVAALNPAIQVETHLSRADALNVRQLVSNYDAVVDCTDSFLSRYQISDACVLENRPLVFGSIYRFSGQVIVFSGAKGPCLRCLFPERPERGSVPSCSEGGVLGPIAGIVGSWQANETLKLLLGMPSALTGSMMLIDSLRGDCKSIAFDRDPACSMCGDERSAVSVEPNDDEPADQRVRSVSPAQLDDFLEQRGALLLDVREPHEAVLGSPAGTVWIPASQLAARMSELDLERTYVVACRVGVRSLDAMQLLSAAGLRSLYHLTDGLLAYAAYQEQFLVF